MKFVSNGAMSSLDDTPLEDKISIDNFLFEAIDDTQMSIGGYMEVVIDLPQKQYQMDVTTDIFINNEQQKGPITFNFPNICEAFLKEDAWWNVFTKLWTNCPPTKGVRIITFLIRKNVKLHNSHLIDKMGG